MKLSDFDIDFIKFKNESHTFSFQLNNTFFGLKENSLYQTCDIKVEVNCIRNESNITLDYILVGTVDSNCERCLRDIKIYIDAERQDVLRLTSNEELLEEENYISVNHQIYNIYDSLYEEICLNMPTRKICEHSAKQKECEIDHPATESKPDEVDERWAELKKLIDK